MLVPGLVQSGKIRGREGTLRRDRKIQEKSWNLRSAKTHVCKTKLGNFGSLELLWIFFLYLPQLIFLLSGKGMSIRLNGGIFGTPGTFGGILLVSGPDSQFCVAFGIRNLVNVWSWKILKILE